MTIEGRLGFTPRLRPGEQLPVAPEGKAVTRVYGKLVFVSAKGPNEDYAGKSAYTERQLTEIVSIMHGTADAREQEQPILKPYLGLYTG